MVPNTTLGTKIETATRQTTGMCMLERAHACIPVRGFVSIFLARAVVSTKKENMER